MDTNSRPDVSPETTPDGFHDIRRPPTSDAERLFGAIQVACAGADFRSVAQALLDSLTVAIAWAFDTPDEANHFIDQLPSNLKREVLESWDLVRDPANRVHSEIGRG